MYDTIDSRVRYDDHRRQMAWVNDNDWQFERPRRRRRVRETVARVLIALVARLASPNEQPRTAS